MLQIGAIEMKASKDLRKKTRRLASFLSCFIMTIEEQILTLTEGSSTEKGSPYHKSQKAVRYQGFVHLIFG